MATPASANTILRTLLFTRGNSALCGWPQALNVTGLPKMGISSLLAPKQGSHEASLVSEDAAALVSNAISVNELAVDAETAPIFLVFRQVREAKERQRSVARAL